MAYRKDLFHFKYLYSDSFCQQDSPNMCIFKEKNHDQNFFD